MMEMLVNILVLGAASAALSVTVTKSHMFLWFRSLFLERPVLLQLVSCYYCMGHWFALALVAVHNPWPTVVGFITTWLAVTAVSGLLSAKIVGD